MTNKVTDLIDLLDFSLFEGFLAEQKLKKATDVQVEAIPLFLDGQDLVVLAKTGSGKTFSYLLPIFQRIKELELVGVESEKAGSPKAVIIVPVKELARQVQSEAKKISHHIKLRVRMALGGEKGKKVSSLKTQKFEVLISTPGRLASMLKSGEINFNSLEHFVIDEADQLMDMGFIKDIHTIKKNFKSKVQVALFSATRPADFNNLTKEVFSGFDFKEIIKTTQTGADIRIETFNIALEYTEKRAMLKLFLEKEAQGNGIIFANQKDDAKRVFDALADLKLKSKVSLIHGDLSAEQRKEAISQYRSTKGILVTTDILARGFDMKGLQWVLNYDLPFETVYYIHRAGRVGRHGSLGRVYNFVTKKDHKLIDKINESIQSQSSLVIEPISLKTAASKKKSPSKSQKKVTRKKAQPKKTPRYKRK